MIHCSSLHLSPQQQQSLHHCWQNLYRIVWIMSLAWDSDSSSEDEFDAYDVTKLKLVFQQRLLHELKLAKIRSHLKNGIQRQPGHYQLRNQCHADVTPKVVGYQGKHWDVSTENSLQRGTRRLTADAIDKEVTQEQMQRSERVEADMITALGALHKVNCELMNIIGQSKEREKHVHDEQYIATVKVKDAVHAELLRKVNQKFSEKETEMEREGQVAMMSLVHTLETAGALPGSLKNLISEMSNVHHQKSVVHQDIIEAFARREEEQENAEAEYREAMTSMMDESLNSIKQLFKRSALKVLSTEEQQRRIIVREMELGHRKSLKSSLSFGDVMSELTNTFSSVKKQDEQLTAKSNQLISENRETVLQDLRRTYARNQVSVACSAEKTRRIREQEKVLSSEDEDIEKNKALLVQVQRELILQKFAGKWINLPRVSQSDRDDSSDLSEWDTKQKMIRMRVRRKSHVLSGVE